MSLSDAIKKARPGVYFELCQDDSHGGEPYIAEWHSSEPMPSEAELAQATAELEAQAQAEV